MVSRAGQAVRFAEADARAMGRDTTGVRGMNVGAARARCSRWTSRATTRTCSSSPRTASASARSSREYRKDRGTKGVKTIALTEAKGGLAGALIVREHQDLMFISREGMVQRTAVERDQPLRPRDPGREGHEHPRGRRGQRRRDRRRGLR